MNETTNLKRSSSVQSRLESLNEKHQEYESRLEALQAQLYLTPDEEYEEIKLKKLKLALKDEILVLRRRMEAS